MSGRVAYSSVSSVDPEKSGFDLCVADEDQGPVSAKSFGKSSNCSPQTVMSRPTRKWKVFPGRNRFCCDGLLMTSKQSGIFYFTCALIIITTGLFLGFDCRYLSERLTPAVPIIAIVLFVFVMCTLIRTAFSDPGIIPRATADEAAETERRIDVPGPAGTMQLPPRVKEVEVHGVKIKLKYCFTCKIFRPPRASHCGICDNCVERFDHHCPWVGNCIGRRNYRYFYMFLVALSVDCVFIMSLSVTTLVLRSMEEDFLSAIKESPASLVEAIIAFLSVWSVLGLAGFHTYLSLCNVTTNEDIKHSSSKATHGSGLYSRKSLCANYLEVVCGPVKPSLIDRRGFVMSLTEDFGQRLPPTLDVSSSALPDEYAANNAQEELLNNVSNVTTDSKAPILEN